MELFALAATPMLAIAGYYMKKIHANDTLLQVLRKEMTDFKATSLQNHQETRADLRDVKDSLTGVVNLLMHHPGHQGPSA